MKEQEDMGKKAFVCWELHTCQYVKILTTFKVSINTYMQLQRVYTTL
jgi:hypothetical protein